MMPVVGIVVRSDVDPAIAARLYGVTSTELIPYSSFTRPTASFFEPCRFVDPWSLC